MKSLEEIREQLCSGDFELTRHALKRQAERNISRNDIRDIGENVVIIEDQTCPKIKFLVKKRKKYPKS